MGLAASTRQAIMAGELAAGLAEAAAAVDHPALLEMVMVAAFLVQADDPAELIAAAASLQLN